MVYPMYAFRAEEVSADKVGHLKRTRVAFAPVVPRCDVVAPPAVWVNLAGCAGRIVVRAVGHAAGGRRYVGGCAER